MNVTARYRDVTRRWWNSHRLLASRKNRDRIYARMPSRSLKAVNYRSAGTVEFLVDHDGNHYFIEMNPRIQVEHTVTEMTTGVDIVQSQILIAEGHRLDSDIINIKSQDEIKPRGYSIQCRLTTEDPINGFAPDTGIITKYTSAGRIWYKAGWRQCFREFGDITVLRQSPCKGDIVGKKF